MGKGSEEKVCLCFSASIFMALKTIDLITSFIIFFFIVNFFYAFKKFNQFFIFQPVLCFTVYFTSKNIIYWGCLAKQIRSGGWAWSFAKPAACDVIRDGEAGGQWMQTPEFARYQREYATNSPKCRKTPYLRVITRICELTPACVI